MAGVVSVSEKAGCTRQVSAGKMNASAGLPGAVVHVPVANLQALEKRCPFQRASGGSQLKFLCYDTRSAISHALMLGTVVESAKLTAQGLDVLT